MKIECPKCGGRGQVEGARIPVSGTTIRCPRCKEQFTIQRNVSSAIELPVNAAEAEPFPDPFERDRTMPPPIARPAPRPVQKPRPVPDDKWWKKPLIHTGIWLVIVFGLMFAVVEFELLPKSPPGGMTDDERYELLGELTMGWFGFGTGIIWYKAYKKKEKS